MRPIANPVWLLYLGLFLWISGGLGIYFSNPYHTVGFSEIIFAVFFGIFPAFAVWTLWQAVHITRHQRLTGTVPPFAPWWAVVLAVVLIGCTLYVSAPAFYGLWSGNFR
jgi:hypothetical protein